MSYVKHDAVIVTVAGYVARGSAGVDWAPITMLPNDTLTFTIDPAKLNKVHQILVRCE